MRIRDLGGGGAGRGGRARAGAAGLARAQHGIVSAGQLAGLGLGRGAIAHRIATGRMAAIHPGVYVLGPSRHARWLAAVMACGPGAYLSHRSAAEL